MRLSYMRKADNEISKMTRRRPNVSDAMLLAELAPAFLSGESRELSAAVAAIQQNPNNLEVLRDGLSGAAKRMRVAIKKELQFLEKRRKLEESIAVYLLIA